MADRLSPFRQVSRLRETRQTNYMEVGDIISRGLTGRSPARRPGDLLSRGLNGRTAARDVRQLIRVLGQPLVRELQKAMRPTSVLQPRRRIAQLLRQWIGWV